MFLEALDFRPLLISSIFWVGERTQRTSCSSSSSSLTSLQKSTALGSWHQREMTIDGLTKQGEREGWSVTVLGWNRVGNKYSSLFVGNKLSFLGNDLQLPLLSANVLESCENLCWQPFQSRLIKYKKEELFRETVSRKEM